MSCIDDNPALIIGLQAAVPLWIHQLGQYHHDTRDRIRARWAAQAVEDVAYRGDVLQYGSKRRGEAAAAFNSLARGLAAMAYQPGGVTAFGEHWCVNHTECEAAAEWAASNPIDTTMDPPAQPDTCTYRGRPITTVNLPEVV